MAPKHHESASTVVNWKLYDDETGQIHPHEPLERYTPGGFHPVALGDTLQGGRYIIRHKLGYGGSSTVWLASDEQNRESAHRHVYVAIKIKSSSASGMGIDADPEVLSLRKLEEHYLQGPQDKPRPYAHLLDKFSHEGPNGRHNCLVTELLGPSIASVCSLYALIGQTLRPETVMRASRQVLQAVDFIHEAGLAHGDISAANIVFTCKSLLEAEGHDLLDLLSEHYVAKPYPDKPLPSPHLPKQLVQTAKWEMWEDETVEDIRLVDWGSAFSVGKIVAAESLAQPIDLRSPETFFIGKLDRCHDIWRIGCVIFRLFYQQSPFWVYNADIYWYLVRMIRKLGPLPEAWVPKFAEIRKESKNHEEEVDHLGDSELIRNTFEPRCQEIFSEATKDDPDYGPDEHTEYDCEALKCLLRPMLALLRYEPKDRTTVRDALEMIDWVDHRREGEDSKDG